MSDKFKASIRETQLRLYHTMQQQAVNDFIGGCQVCVMNMTVWSKHQINLP